MKPHSRHVAIAVVIAIVLLIVATVAARADDFTQYSGAQLYQRFCASCHGDEGHGDGVVAASFSIEVPDLTRLAKRHGGEFPQEQVRKIIDGTRTLPPHGSRDMPVWGYEFRAQATDQPDPKKAADAMIDRLTDYVRSLQKS
jgi:mono/diheme cytochrome c family protein